jgi:hypothetical protein
MRRLLSFSLGGLLLAVGISVFLIRFQHAGTYVMPGGGNLLSGVLALALGGALLTPRLQQTATFWIGVLAGPVILFFALYATLAELEEVISIKAYDNAGKPANLRLWVIDYDDNPWVTMPASKSDEHSLEDGPVIMFRDGLDTCVMATRLDDREAVNNIHHRRHEKYLIQRLATQIGLFGENAGPDTVTLRLDPCPGNGSSEL